MLKARNPFPKIWNVIKYDFQYSARTFIPVYAVLLILSILRGLFSKTLVSVQAAEGSYQVYSQSTGIASFVLGFFFFIFYVAAFVVTIIILTKRYKQSMLGDEAYLNHSLPVTIGEHLWGHFLIDLFWFICCNLLTLLAFYLAFRKDLSSDWSLDFMRRLKEEFLTNGSETGLTNPASKIILTSIIVLVLDSLYISFVFVINSIGHFFGRNKTPAIILAIVILVFTYSKFSGLIFNAVEPHNFTSFAWTYILFNLFFVAAFFTSSWAILKFRLNLE